jgi:hypothetical protein
MGAVMEPSRAWSAGGGRPTRATLAWLAAPSVAVIVFAAGWLTYGVVTAGPAPPKDAAERPRGFSCVQVVAAGEEMDDYCSRLATGLSRRAALDDEQRRTAEPAKTAIEQLVAGSGQDSCRDPSVSCLAATEHADAPPAVDDVQQRLIAAGWPRAVVRIARSDDPAPRGSLIFAVPAGPVCVLGHLRSRWLVDSSMVVGTLADGSCLAG